MIIVVHDNKKVVKLIGLENMDESYVGSLIGEVVFLLAERFPDEIISWCQDDLLPHFDTSVIDSCLHHSKMIISFNPLKKDYINCYFGYADHASILRVNKTVLFATWKMSSQVGAAKSVLLNSISNQVKNKKENFDYLLCSVAIRAHPNGLFCYSEPKLLSNYVPKEQNKSSNNYVLFRFVKQHKDFKWLFVLLFNLLLFEKKIVFFPFLYSLFFKRRKWNNKGLGGIVVDSAKKMDFSEEIDVIIPTIGRAQYLYNVLCDLRVQTHLPKKVIIVEQNPLKGSSTELNFVNNEKWPFPIEHIFTHQTGVCNARNVALSKVEHDWVFMCDDDNRFEHNLIKEVFLNAKKFGIEALLLAYLQNNEQVYYSEVHQTTIFGSGNAFLATRLLKTLHFDSNYEYCYGEDFDFGMQLRNSGVDLVHFANPFITHLKAPMGGFRIKPILKWDQDEILPIPSPTILLNYLKYRTSEQLNFFQFIYYFDKWKINILQNPFNFIQKNNSHWNASLKWSKKLLKSG